MQNIAKNFLNLMAIIIIIITILLVVNAYACVLCVRAFVNISLLLLAMKMM